MKKRAILLLLILPFVLHGQSEELVLEWESDHGNLSFHRALYADGENTLPYLSRKIPWESARKHPEVRLEVLESSPVNPEWIRSMDLDHVKAAPLLEHALLGQMGANYLSVKILPFFKKEDGSLWKTERMRMLVEQKSAMASLKFQRKGSWNSSSVLASGNWYKIAIGESGMHRLSYEQLQEIGLGNPASVRVFGSGARRVPEAYSQGAVDDLEPVSVYLDKGSDGMFGPGDQLFFYAEGPVSWSYDQEDSLFRHSLHPYSTKGYYFLTDDMGPAEAVPEAVLSQDAPTTTVSTYDYLAMEEEERYNLIHSGRKWLGDVFKITLEYNYPFQIPRRVEGEPVKAYIAVAARAGSPSTFQARMDGENKGSIEIPATNLSYYTATHAYTGDLLVEHLPASDVLTLQLEYEQQEDAQGWLDHIILNARSELSLGSASQLAFRDIRSVQAAAVSRFRLEQGAASVIWDISDPGQALHIDYRTEGSTAIFELPTSQLREFIAFDPSGTFPSPDFKGEGLGLIPSQNLHGMEHPDMVILAPEVFLEEARRLAEHRRSNDGLEVEVVTQTQVFNEFSSGTPDIAATRNFMKMFYDRSGGGEDYCRYLLLFGDGSFDNRGSEGKVNNPNLLLTYQSPESLSPTRSYTSDDFFGLLDTDEGMYNGLLDIGIGRLPASTVDEARNLVDKLISYDQVENQGDWRNQISFIGDDEDGNIHMRQADELADYVNTNYPAYNIGKIYLDAYPQYKSTTGFSYPDAEVAINNQVNLGALIVNYTGHGGTTGLAHEKVVTLQNISSWSNGNKLPLFMTATCEFSRYDEYDIDVDAPAPSAGEEVLLSTKGGGIGLFTTTRLVYSGPNHILNEHFYEVVFEKNANQENYRLGDIIAYSKNETGAGVNKRNFTLLGDPSLRLSYPENRIVTDSINHSSVAETSDTLSAFEWVSVSGHVETRDGSLMEQFNGTVYPVVFDKNRPVETLSNDNTTSFNFKTRNNILYRGKADVKDGMFSFGFYVPKDISYSFGNGKISYYANDSITDAHGSWEEFIVGGIGTENALDLEPPELDLFINDSFFVSGGMTDSNPWLLVYARDNFGINTTGNGIGHDLTATLDGNRLGATILNEFFQSDANSHNSGSIRYPYYDLEEGRHEIAVKIWDIHNNSAEERIEFVVVKSRRLVLENLFNYPNPFTDITWFNIEHNRPDEELDLEIRLYDLNGALVRIIKERIYAPGYRLEPISWDGRGSGGAKLGAGLYLYQVSLSTLDGELASDNGKLILVD